MINRQRHKKSCGPVAIVNSLQWCEQNSSYKNILSLSEKHGFKYKLGMSGTHIMNVLKEKNIKHRLIRKAKLETIIKEIDNKNSVILAFSHSKAASHFVFIDKYTKKYVRAWNLTNYNKTPKFSRKKLSNFIRYSNRWANQPWGLAAYIIVIKKDQN